jgi:hypothetical protein
MVTVFVGAEENCPFSVTKLVAAVAVNVIGKAFAELSRIAYSVICAVVAEVRRTIILDDLYLAPVVSVHWTMYSAVLYETVSAATF